MKIVGNAWVQKVCYCLLLQEKLYALLSYAQGKDLSVWHKAVAMGTYILKEGKGAWLRTATNKYVPVLGSYLFIGQSSLKGSGARLRRGLSGASPYLISAVRSDKRWHLEEKIASSFLYQVTLQVSDVLKLKNKREKKCLSLGWDLMEEPDV